MLHEETSLHIAAKRGLIKCMEFFVKRGVDVNTPDLSGYRALHCAVERRHREAVNWLLVQNADPNVRDLIGNTPLHLVEFPSEIFSQLIAYGALVNAKNITGRTVLHSFIMQTGRSSEKSHHLQNLVEEFGADVNIADNFGNTAMHMIRRQMGSMNGSTLKWLASHGAHVDRPNAEGMTPLHYACIGLQTKLIGWLLEMGANCRAVDSWGMTPLHYLFSRNSVNVDVSDFRPVCTAVDLLVRNGADVCARTRSSLQTALHLSSRKEDNFCANKTHLRLYAARVVVDALGNTPMHYGVNLYTRDWLCSQLVHRSEHVKNACGRSIYLSAARYLIYKSQSVWPCVAEDRDRFNRNILHMCCSDFPSISNNDKFIENCKKCNLFDDVDFLGRTPLHHLCIASFACSGNAQVFQQLFRTQLNSQDMFGRTPLFYAALCKGYRLVELLISAGANPDISDANGILPEDVFRARGRECDVLSSRDKQKQGDRRVNPELTVDNSSKSGTCIQQNDGALLCPTAAVKVWQFEGESCDTIYRPESQMNPHERIKYGSFLSDSVCEFVELIIRKVSQLDSRFEGRAVLVGSTRDNTKCAGNDEFDFLIVLKELSSKVKVERSSDLQNFVKCTKRHEVDSGNHDVFLNSDSSLELDMVKERLYSLIIIATSYPTMWRNGVFEYLSFRVENKPKSPSIMMTVAVNRLMIDSTLVVYNNPDMCISIDIVPCVMSDELPNPDTPFAKYVAQYSKEPTQCFAIFKTPKFLVGHHIHGLVQLLFLHWSLTSFAQVRQMFERH